MDRLSAELLVKILAHLGVEDLQASRLTSRRFRAAIEGSVELCYQHRLRLAGRADIANKSSCTSLSQHLADLNGLEDAWRYANFTQTVSIASFSVLSDSEVLTFYARMNSLYVIAGQEWTVNEVLRLSDGRTSGSAEDWQRLQISSVTSRPDKMALDVVILEETCLLMVISVIVNNDGDDVSGIVFDFYHTETMQPHSDAIQPSVTLRFAQTFQPHPPGEDLSTFDSPISGHGDTILFILRNHHPDAVTHDTSQELEVFFCLRWKEGLVHTLRAQESCRQTAPTFVEANLFICSQQHLHCLELCSLLKDSTRPWTLHTLCYLRFPALGVSVLGNRIGEMAVYRDYESSGVTDADWQNQANPRPFPLLPSQSICAVRIVLQGLSGHYDDDRTFYLVIRTATFAEIALEVAPGETFDWPEPEGCYVYLDTQTPPTSPATQTVNPNMDSAVVCMARTLEADAWLGKGATWLNTAAELHNGDRAWGVSGQRLIARGFESEGRIPPLRLYNFNIYDVQRALSLIRTGNLELVQTDVEHTMFGPWYRLPNGNKLAVVDEPFAVSTARPTWWGEDLVSNLPFTIVETQQAQAWPLLTVFGDFILRLQSKESLNYEVFRVGK
ncbi:unnamed protein product [Peniophora sp. CBMAI 1063]|nr:unnamed protein product [Peniophora sp. CBMAI 1063]